MTCIKNTLYQEEKL